MNYPVTQGVHHVGLTVTDLDASCRFFCELLGWEKVGGNPDYPAVFVSDGSIMVTLWQARQPSTAKPFDKNNNVGLHHLARILHEGGRTLLLIYRHFNHLIKSQS